VKSREWLLAPFGAEYACRPTWGLWERSYVRTFGLLDFPNRLRARIIAPELEALHPQKVLDLGSGTGCYSFYLSRNQRVVVSGVEIDQGRISESRHIAKCLGRNNLQFYLGSSNGRLRNFPPETFEVVLAVEVLQYLPDVRLTLREIYRVAKPGGHLLGHVPALGYLRPEETTLFNDERIQTILSEANFHILKIVPTFGGALRKLCALYDLLSHSRMLVGMFFPFFLFASTALRVENPKGQYRFFIARKPLGESRPTPTVH